MVTCFPPSGLSKPIFPVPYEAECARGLLAGTFDLVKLGREVISAVDARLSA